MEQIAALLPEEKRPLFAKLAEQCQAFFTGKAQLSATTWKDYRFSPGFEATTAQYAYDKWDMKENAVYIASYPKTGTNWTLGIVAPLLYGDNLKEQTLFKSLPPMFVALSMGSAEKFELIKHIPLRRKMFMTHLPAELLNIEKIKKTGGKIIYIIRNPKDQAVSWFHFAQGQIFDRLRDLHPRDWNDFFDCYVQCKQPLFVKEGEWYPDHLLGWYKYKDDKDILFIHFEDMKKDLSKEVRRIAQFLEIKLSDERLQSIVEASSFEAIKKNVQADSSDMAKVLETIKIMRKGQVGSWKETFSKEQSELVDKLVNEKLGRTDIKFTYEL